MRCSDLARAEDKDLSKMENYEKQKTNDSIHGRFSVCMRQALQQERELYIEGLADWSFVRNISEVQRVF